MILYKAVLEAINIKFKDLENLLDGLFLLNELTPKISDKLVSFGELTSSYIIAETMKSRGIDVIRKNTQELIVTDLNHGNAEVKFGLTTTNIQNYFNHDTKFNTGKD